MPAHPGRGLRQLSESPSRETDYRVRHLPGYLYLVIIWTLVVDEAPLKPRPNFMKQNAPGGLPRAAENSHSALRRIIFSYLHDCNALSLIWSCGFELQSGPSWHRRYNFCLMKILSLTVKTKQIVHDIAWKRQKLSGPCDFPNWKLAVVQFVASTCLSSPYFTSRIAENIFAPLL